MPLRTCWCGRIIPRGGACPEHPRKRSPSSKATREPGWKATRDAVLKRDGYICQRCGGPAVEVDHVIPVSQGGANDMSNLVAACLRCNRTKGARQA